MPFMHRITGRPARTRARRSALVVGAAAALAATLVGCGSSSSSSSAAGSGGSGVTNITLGVVAGNSQENAYVAQAKGFFKQHGLNAKFTVLTGGGAEAVAAIEGGSMTMAEGNIVSVLQGAQHGIDTPCFAGGVGFNTKGDAYAIVGAKGVTSAKQLAGKGVAVISDNSANTLLVDAWLQANGVDYKSVKDVIVTPPNMQATLQHGSALAAAAPDPFSSQILQSSGTMLSRDPDQYIAGHPLFACWQASSKWLAGNQKVVREFIAAMNQADAYEAAHPAAANAAAAPLMKVSAKSLDGLIPWKFTMSMSQKDITSWENVGKKFGVLSGSVKMPDVYDPVSGS